MAETAALEQRFHDVIPLPGRRRAILLWFAYPTYVSSSERRCVLEALTGLDTMTTRENIYARLQDYFEGALPVTMEEGSREMHHALHAIPPVMRYGFGGRVYWTCELERVARRFARACEVCGVALMRSIPHDACDDLLYDRMMEAEAEARRWRKNRALLSSVRKLIHARERDTRANP